MMHDGVNRLWILRTHSGLNVDGFKDDFEAIDRLIRHALTVGPADAKARIEATVAEALKHNDEPDDIEPAKGGAR